MRETNAEKRRKIGDLTLTDDEWDRVRLFCNLLQVRSTVDFVFFLLIFSL
jgi:ABC-type cobalamin transport system ATPase subunit